jgi:hypothetical protein
VNIHEHSFTLCIQYFILNHKYSGVKCGKLDYITVHLQLLLTLPQNFKEMGHYHLLSSLSNQQLTFDTDSYTECSA